MEAIAHVKFKFSKETKFGESIHIVGSHASLGSWDPQKSVKLITDPSVYPFWTTPMIELPMSSTIEYKYLFFVDDSVTWESLGNRKLFLTQKRVVVEDTDSSSVSKIFYSQSDFSNTEDLFDEASKLKPSDSLLILTISLPVTVRKSSAGVLEFEQTKGVWQSQLYSVLLSRNNEFLWFGLAPFAPQSEEERESIAKTMKEKFRCVPVFIEPSLLEEHEKYCSLVLYKLLHNIIDLSIEATQCNVSLWTSYKRFNILFSEQMLQYYTGQMIWIHGPQFFLVPSFLSRRTKEIMNIGFFLHHPFPSSEILRMFPYREAILHALCCCDLIGFHLFPYARNFLGCCKRVLGLNVEPTKGGYFGLNYFGRYIMVKSEHIGVQPEIIEHLSSTPESLTCYEELEEKYQGKRVILSIDAAHELAGIHMKFKAFQIAWEKMKQKPLFLQILIPQQTLVENLKIKDQVMVLAEQINKNIGVPIIEIIEKNISNEERYAYMKISHGLVINCIKDGLCIQPFEYLVIKREKSRIVLSEFTGVSTAVSSPKKVNPFHVISKQIQELKEAIEEVAGDELDEHRINGIRRDLKYIYSHDTSIWVERFLNDLKKAHKDTENLHYLVHGLGDKLKLIALRKNFKKLNKGPLLEAYSQSSNRVLIFDNEGTLSNFMKQTEINKKVGPSSRILRALQKLCEDDKNTVYVVTGRPREIVYNWFKSVDNLGLAAEYGAIMKAPSSHDWKSHFSISGNWKQSAKEIMAGYCERTEGSFIVEKESSIVFHYREAEAEFGSYQAKELLSHLEFLLQPFMDEIEIAEGIGYVEVKPIGISKGTALFRVFESVFESKGPADFVLAIGDDNSDEDMFKMVRTLKNQKSRTLLHSRIPAFTCTLGIKPSSANYFLLDASKVVSLLERINGETGNSKKNFSYDDLRNKKFGTHLRFDSFKRNDLVDENSEE